MFIIDADASNIGVAAALSEVQDDHKRVTLNYSKIPNRQRDINASHGGNYWS
jgi:hypothetical protein